MRIFRSKLSWVLAFLFLMILINLNGCRDRKLSTAREAEYQADTSEYDKKTNKANVNRAKDRLDELRSQNAPDDQIEEAQLQYIQLMQDYINPGPKPYRDDSKYDEPRRPRTGHSHAHRPVKTIPPVTSHPPKPPKPPKPPCTDHH